MLQAAKIAIVTTVMSSVVMLCMLFVVAPQVSADTSLNIDNKVKCGSNISGLGDGGCNSNVAGSSVRLEKLTRTIINVFSAIVGAVSVIMIIIGGFRYIISGGDSNNVGAAKNTILYAIVGLIIVAFAQVIVQFVLQRTV